MKQESFFAKFEALVHEPAFQVLTLAGGVYGVLWLRIFRRAGLSTFLGILLLVPPLTLILPFYLAFTRWPVERPVMRTKTRKVPIQSIPRYALEEQLRPGPTPLALPNYVPSSFAHGREVYGGRDFVPLRLRSGS